MANDILVKVGADISDFSRKMAESQRTLKTFATANQQTFDSFKKVGKVATAAGVTIAAGLGFAVKKAADFESGMSEVAAISGATGKDFDKLSDKAREMGSKTSFSATESAEALKFMALAGWDANDSADSLEGVLHLAEAGNLDLGRASDLTTDSMAGLGLEAKDLDGYLDKVASTSSNANTDIDALMEAFVVAGGTLDRLNVPLAESNAFLGVLANRGFKGAEAGTAINAIMSRMTKETGPAADALKDMGVAVFDADGKFRGMEAVMQDVKKETDGMTDAQRENALTQVAGLNHGKTFNAMLEGLGDEYGELKGKVEDSDGALKKMRDTMKDNLQGALENLSSAFEEVMISIGTALLPAVKKLASGLQGLANWFNGLSDSTKTTIAVVAAIAAAFLLVVGPILLLIGFIPAIISGFSALGVVIAALTSPIALVIAAVIGAAALVYVFWEPIAKFFNLLWEGIKTAGLAVWESLKIAWQATVDFFIDLWSGVSEFFVNLWETVKEAATNVWTTLREVWQSAVDFIIELFTPIVEFFSSIFGNIFDTVSEVWASITEMLSTVWDGIATIAQGAWEIIKNVILGPILLLINLLTGNFEEFKANLSAIWENIASAASTIWTGIKTAVSGIINGLINIIKAYWEGLKTNLSITMNAIKGIATTVWNGIKTGVSAIVSGLVSAVTGLWNGLKSTITGVLNGISSIASSVWEGIKSTLTGIVDGLVSGIQTAWDTIKSATQTAFDAVVGFIKSPLEGIDLLSIGKNIINGLINGIKDKVKAVKDAVKEVASAITGKIKSILGIKSPSRVLKKLGVFTGQGLEIGIESMAGKVGKAAAGLADAATPDMGRVNMAYATPSGVKSSLSSAVNGTVDVNTRDDMLAGAIGDLRRDLTNLRVEMDGRTVGRIVEPHVSQTQDLKKRTRDSFAGRG